MDKAIAEKRGLLILLVFITIMVFIGLVWAIATYLPFNSAASAHPSETMDAPRAELNCASPVVYWMDHPEDYPPELVVGGKVYLAAELKGIFDHASSSLPARLQAQLLAAYLNIRSGAEAGYIQTTIFEAYGWLAKHPSDAALEAVDEQEGTRLLNLLEAFNLGQTGVAPCETVSLTQQAEMSKVTETETATTTSTPSPSETAASDTPTPTATETNAPVYTYVVPTRAATKTASSPGDSQPPPTNTSVPIPPTEPPQNTPVPPKPTATFPNPPTAAPTHPSPPPPTP